MLVGDNRELHVLEVELVRLEAPVRRLVLRKLLLLVFVALADVPDRSTLGMVLLSAPYNPQNAVIGEQAVELLGHVFSPLSHRVANRCLLRVT